MRQWTGSKSDPLKSSKVFAEIKPVLDAYGVEVLWTEQSSYDDKRELADQVGICLASDPFTESEWKEHAKRLESTFPSMT